MKLYRTDLVARVTVDTTERVEDIDRLVNEVNAAMAAAARKLELKLKAEKIWPQVLRVDLINTVWNR